MSSFWFCSANNPCRCCGAVKDCRETTGGLVFCHTHRSPYDLAPGYRNVGLSQNGVWGLWVREDGAEPTPRTGRSAAARKAPKQPKPADPVFNKFNSIGKRARGLDDAELREFAVHLGLPMESLHSWRIVRMDGPFKDEPHIGAEAAWALPEWGYGDDGVFRQVGWHVRRKDGEKRTYGAVDAPVKRGLTLLDGYDQGGPLYLVEGQTNSCALWAMGLSAIGRPSNLGGVDFLVRFIASTPALDGRDIVVIGDNDKKANGAWPGREGAEKTAAALAKQLNRPVKVGQAPEGHKDCRDWFKANRKPGRNTHELAEPFRKAVGALRVIRPENVQAGAEKPLPVAAAVMATVAIVSNIASEEQVWEGVAAQIRAAMEAHKPKAPVYDPYAEENAAAAARRIAEMRRDQERYECSCCRGIVLRQRQTNEPFLAEVRCEKWLCDGCKAYLVDREVVSARWHFGQAQQLFEGNYSAEEWATVHRRIQRRKGQYLRCVEAEGCYWVVSSVRVAGMIPVSVQQAWTTLRTLLVAFQGERRPVSTSRGWCLPEDESTGDFARVGMAAAGLSGEDIDAIAEDVGAMPLLIIPQDAPRCKIRRVWRFVRAEGWDCDTWDRLSWHLYAGEVTPTISPEMATGWRAMPVERTPDVFEDIAAALAS